MMNTDLICKGMHWNFSDYNILIVKEEGDTPQGCKAYKKDVSLSEKRHHCHFPNGISMAFNMVDQYALIL